MFLKRSKIKNLILGLLLIVPGFGVSAQDGIIKESPLQIGLGTGVFNYQGEINNSNASSPFVGQMGITFDASRKLYSFLDVGFTFMNGVITGNNPVNHLNFQTSLNSISVYGFYNWNHFFPNKIVQPYTSIGLETFEFNSKGDMVDASGNPYYYWNDGSVKNLPQSAPNAADAIVLHRDYFYETDLRKANLDGLGEYSQVSFAVPIGFGLLFNISDRFHLRMGSTFHYTFTDLIDNVSPAGTGVRKGSAGNDYYFFNSVSLHYDWIGSGPSEKAKFKFVDYFALNTADNDNDGIIDWYDHCLGTPKGVAVDSNGCPVDIDRDGIGDFKDKQVSADSAFVDSNGVEMTDADYFNWYRRFIDSVDIPIDVKRKMTASNTTKGATYRIFVGEFSKIPDSLVERFLAQPDIISALDKENKTLYLVGKYGDLDQAKARQKLLLDKWFPIAKIVVQQGSEFIPLEEFEKQTEQKQNEKIKDVEGQYAIKLGNTAVDANLEEKSKFFKGKAEVKTLKADKNSTDYVEGSFKDLTEANRGLKDVDPKLFPNAKVVKVKDGKVITENDSAFFEKTKPKEINPLQDLEGKYVVKAGKITDKTTAEEKKKLESLPNSVIVQNSDGSKDVLVGKFDNSELGKKSLTEMKTKGLAKSELLKVENGQLKKPSPELKEGEYAVKVGKIDGTTTAEEKKKLEAIPNSIQIQNSDGSKDVVVGSYNNINAGEKSLTEMKANGLEKSELLKVENGKLKKITPELKEGEYAVKVGKIDATTTVEEKKKLESIPNSIQVENADGTKDVVVGTYKDVELATKTLGDFKKKGFVAPELVKVENGKLKNASGTANVEEKKEPVKETPVDTVKNDLGNKYAVKVGEFEKGASGEEMNKLLSISDIQTTNTVNPNKTVVTAGKYDSEAEAKKRAAQLNEQGIATEIVKFGDDGKTIKNMPNSKGEAKQASVNTQAVVYRVQLGAFRNKVSTAAFKGNNVVSFEGKDKLFRYATGSFAGYKQAQEHKAKMRSQGFTDAFVAAYKDGDRVQITDLVKPDEFVEDKRETAPEKVVVPKTEVEKEIVTKKVIEKVQPKVDSGKVIYKVQLAAVAVTSTQSEEIKKVPELQIELANNYRRYLSGNFTNFTDAVKRKEEMAKAGYPGAYVVSYQNDKRVAVSPSRDENMIHDSEIENTKAADTSKVDISTLKIQVQVGLFSGEIPAEVKAIFEGISDIKIETTPQGLKRYTTGDFKNPAEAAAYKESLKAKGLKDAFLIAYYKGIKINLASAMNYYEKRK